MSETTSKPKLVVMCQVYNEERNIRRFLDSLGFADEICLLDNGGMDGTIEKARSYPNVVVRECENSHTHKDFHEGEAKNELLQFAKSRNPDWILDLDCDEIFEEKATKELPRLLLNESVSGYMFSLYPFWMSETRFRIDHDWGNFLAPKILKLFRNQENTHYSKRKMHAGWVQGLIGKVVTSGLRIKHFTIQTQKEADRKFERYTKAGPGRDFSHLNSAAGAVYREWQEVYPKVDVIIPAFNLNKMTKRCMDTLETTGEDFNLILIDNGSDTPIKGAAIKNEKNLGAIKAYQQGIEASTADKIILLNNDVFVEANFIKNMYDTGYDIVCSLYEGEREWPNFSCTMIDRKVLEKVKLNTEDYFLGFGADDEFLYEAEKAGFTIGFNRWNTHQHKHRATVITIPDYEKLVEKERQIFFSRYKQPYGNKKGAQERENSHKKVLIAVLNQYNDVNIELAIRLPNIARYGSKRGLSVKVKPFQHKPIAHNRNTIVKEFLAKDYDFLMMVDCDVVPPVNILDLTELNLPIAGGLFYTWQDQTKPPLIPLVMKKFEGGYRAMLDIRPNQGLKEVDAFGTGCMIIRRDVLEKVKAPFMRKWSEDGLQELGLDFYFCERAKKLGFQSYVHTNYPCGHWCQVDMLRVMQAFI